MFVFAKKIIRNHYKKCLGASNSRLRIDVFFGKCQISENEIRKKKKFEIRQLCASYKWNLQLNH